MQTKHLPYTLGLDIGMASVGAALLLPDRQRILALHVRTFDKAETAKEGESLNKIRRDSRLARRRIRRRAHRLLRLARLMKRAGLIADASPETFALPDTSPWDLRAAGLDRRLEPKEWATVLYHIVKHRGFQSNRKSEAKADEKAGEMLSGVGRNQALLKINGYRTIGELAAHHEDFNEAKRNKGGSYSHTFARADLAEELKLLFGKQHTFGNTHAGADFQAAAHDLLMARKPTLSGDNLLKMVGKCTFEKAEYRAPKASYRAERFVWLGKLNNLKIVGNGDARALTDNERRAIIDLPFTQAKLTFKQVRKSLALEPHERFNLLSYRLDPKGKDKDPEEVALFEAKAFHMLRKAYDSAGLKTEWQRDALDHDRLDTLAYALTVFKDDAESRQWLAERGIAAPIVEAVLDESFDQFIHLSQKALKAILPFMEAGQRYDEAAQSAGYRHSQPDAAANRKSYLPPPDKDTIRNPVVYRALNQARKLVNAIVREYGPPAAVHIELARDLSKPKKERDEIQKEQEKYRKEKERVAEQFIGDVGREPKQDELLKMRLYHEQGSQCPYCQSALDINRMFETGYSQVDHALPYRRSFDDSMNNKVVVHTKCNQDKGDLTPYEFLNGASDSPRWQRFIAWVQSNKAIRQAKRNRLLRVNFGEEEAKEFRARNLTDTRYICREFKRMVETNLQWHPASQTDQRCVVVSGGLTSLLRARWGLIKIRERGDLHHALDAAVVAACGHGTVKRLSDVLQNQEWVHKPEQGGYVHLETGEILPTHKFVRKDDVYKLFPPVWLHFRSELEAHLSPDPAKNLHGLPGYDETADIRPVRVSRAPTRRGLGAAHQETIRSAGKKSKLLKQGQSSSKTPLTALKFTDMDNIVGANDPRNAQWIGELRARLEPYKDEDKKKGKCAGAIAFGNGKPPLLKTSTESDKAKKPGRRRVTELTPDESKQPVVIHRVKLLDTQKSGTPVRGGIANNGSMLRVDIFTKNTRFHAVPVYVSDAAKAELPNRAAKAHTPENQWPEIDETYQFLFSLHPNDWVRIKLTSGIKQGYFAEMDRGSGASLSIYTHDRNQSIGEKGKIRGIGISTALTVEKYHVDLLGNLHRVHKEDRQPIYLPKQKPRKG